MLASKQFSSDEQPVAPSAGPQHLVEAVNKQVFSRSPKSSVSSRQQDDDAGHNTSEENDDEVDQYARTPVSHTTEEWVCILAPDLCLSQHSRN